MSISMHSTAKGKGAKIPRPMNAFMIFAKEHRPLVKKEHPTEENHVISIRLGNMWASLGQEEKDRYQEMSREVANEHRKKYPDYRYEPKPKIRKKRRYDQYLMMDKLRTAAAAEAVREQKEELEKVKHSLLEVHRSHPQITSASKRESCTTSRPPWAHADSIGAHPLEHTHPDGPPNYPSGYYYTPHPNVIPAHSQSMRNPSLVGSYGSIVSDPFILPYTAGVASADLHYTNQPLDMTTAGNGSPYKTQTTTGKVYCDLTTPVQSKASAGPVPTHLLQNWTSRSSHPSHRGDPNRITARTENQMNAKPEATHLPSAVRPYSQTCSDVPTSKTGDGKADLVWIPCEADFAKRLGWSVNQSFQGVHQSSQE